MNAELKNLDVAEQLKKDERLGKCEVCDLQPAKYTCPKCDIKTCCLNCSKIHKKELECTGVRDRTKYIPLKNMTAVDFMNDYYFLEECINFTKDKRNKKGKKIFQSRGISKNCQKLRKMALQRKVKLFYMVEDLARRKANQSAFDSRNNTINWYIDLHFANADNLKLSGKFNENETISNVIQKYLNSDDLTLSKKLEFYKANGIRKIKVLLKADGLKGNQFFDMDLDKSLKKNLTNKIIIEYPIFHVILDHCAGDYEIVDEDDENVQTELLQFQKFISEEVFHKPFDHQPKLQSMPSESTFSRMEENSVVAGNESENISMKSSEGTENKFKHGSESSDEEIEPENFLFSKDDE